MASGKYETLADTYLDAKVRGSSEFMCTCPFCEGSSSLQFNIDSGLWVCFRCDEKGNAKRLVEKMGGVYADPVASVEHLRAHLERTRARIQKKEAVASVLDEHHLARFDFDDGYWTDDRGLSPETVKSFSLGYDPVLDRHTIPYRNEHGDLLGVIQRRTTQEFPRYLYPEKFDRLGMLYGSWLVSDERKIGLVEGSTDTLAMFDVDRLCLAQFGSSISLRQVRLLHRLGIHEVVLFYDYDEAGRKSEEKSRERIDGMILRTAVYDRDKYCWHKKNCGCGQHTWRTIGKCQNKKLCKCGRKHEMDPGSLPKKERQRMFDEAVLVGSKTWSR